MCVTSHITVLSGRGFLILFVLNESQRRQLHLETSLGNRDTKQNYKGVLKWCHIQGIIAGNWDRYQNNGVSSQVVRENLFLNPRKK